MLYDTGHPFKEVFITQCTLTCADPVEPFFYSLGVRARCGLTEKLCCFCAEEEADGPNDELQKMFTAILPFCCSCLSKGAKIPDRHAIRNSAQRASRATVLAQRKAKRDAQTTVAQVPREDIEQVLVPEALEAHHEETDAIASTSHRGRARRNLSRGRSTRGRR